MKNWSSDC